VESLVGFVKKISSEDEIFWGVAGEGQFREREDINAFGAGALKIL
jgi:hypothetical protein